MTPPSSRRRRAGRRTTKPKRHWKPVDTIRSRRMAMNDEDFWDDLLGHIRHQMLVPVIGPDLTAAKVGDADQTFNTLICRRLAERYQLNVSPAVTTMGEAVAAVLRERGRDELDRLYRVIND